jgi:hypothetical protein
MSRIPGTEAVVQTSKNGISANSGVLKREIEPDSSAFRKCLAAACPFTAYPGVNTHCIPENFPKE